jgi:hypothetical protein
VQLLAQQLLAGRCLGEEAVVVVAEVGEFLQVPGNHDQHDQPFTLYHSHCAS